MNRKQRQKLAMAIGTTVLSCAALSLATVDRAQAAVLTYNFTVGDGLGDGFFKFNNSSFTGTGVETFVVFEGRFDTPLVASGTMYGFQGKEYYDLAGSQVSFDGGVLSGLIARGEDGAFKDFGTPEEPGYIRRGLSTRWNISTNGSPSSGWWKSIFEGSSTSTTTGNSNFYPISRALLYTSLVSYTLVDTAAEPVPEPITFSGTALAMAGLGWLKRKKKMAV
ncbi:MAG: PEP-CTERM sorting domain-containing protein [Microcoleus sp.]